MNKNKFRPGWWPYIVAGLMPIAGGVLFIVILVAGILSTGRHDTIQNNLFRIFRFGCNGLLVNANLLSCSP